MKAYAIFDGGGVKGAALAGCLDAAIKQQIHFVGYGGTSAGAIIATLACVGYSGEEIRDLMRTRFHPRSLLDDEGVMLQQAQECIQAIRRVTDSDMWILHKAWQLRGLKRNYQAVLTAIVQDKGLYAGESLKRTLLALMKERLQVKIPAFQHYSDITFEDLKKAGLPPLKIVASDVTNRCAAVFESSDSKRPSDKNRAYGGSVVDAVRASAGYPFLFRPVALGDQTSLVDGGLASNMPSFLFAQEQGSSQFPVICFDLISESNGKRADTLGGFFSQMLDTALEAGDHLISGLGKGVFHVEVPIPTTIPTLKFDLTAADIDVLFNVGFRAATQRFAAWNYLKTAASAGKNIQKELRALYGDPQLFEFLLGSLKTWIQQNSPAEDVRLSIMLPTGRPDNSRIVVYHHGFRLSDDLAQPDTDSDLELDEFGGCTGRCLKNKRPVFCDLEKMRTGGYSDWGLTIEQQRLVAHDRKAILSVPIFAWSFDRRESTEKKESVDELPILGILSIDSATPLLATGWATEGPEDSLVPIKKITKSVLICADVISKLLQKRI